MTLGLGITQTNNWVGIDTAAVSQVSNNIFANASKVKAVSLDANTLSQFKRPELGADLYSGRVDAATQKQIALASNGVFTTVQSTAAAFLSAQAASTAYAPVSAVKSNETPAAKLSANIFSDSVSKDKKGSNPFSFTAQASSEKAAEKAESVSIFA